MAPATSTIKLTIEQRELSGLFYDEACDHPGESLKKICKRVLRQTSFPKTPNGHRFEQQLRRAYDLARPSAPRKSVTIGAANRKGRQEREVSPSGKIMRPKSFITLGVSHRVQGDEDFRDAFDDPTYRDIVKEIISGERIDFVGEEAAINTTHAERIAQNLLGTGHYLNVDPVLEEDKEKYGIGETCLPCPLTGAPVYGWVVAENEKRERIWVDLLIKRTVARGLLICGFYHTFSVAAKLLGKGFEVEARTYLPLEK